MKLRFQRGEIHETYLYFLPKPTRVQVKLDHWEPGAETGRHSHPGPALFIMIEGELEEIRQGGEKREGGGPGSDPKYSKQLNNGVYFSR